MSDPTIVETAVDETFDLQGKVIASTPRVRRQTATSGDRSALRRNLRLIASGNWPGAAVPLWGQILARGLLYATWADEDDSTG